MERALSLEKARKWLTEIVPLMRAGRDVLRGAADEATIALVGPDFEERLRRVHIASAGGLGAKDAADLPSQQVSGQGVDPFGLDPAWAKYAVMTAAFFHKVYFRAEVHHPERVPKGAVLLVSNHSGQLPFDGMVIGASLFLDVEPPRIMRSMVEKWTQTLPFVSTAYSRFGQVVGVPENARRLLSQGEAVLVFPEGARGISKGFSDRYRLAPFGLGFMRLALSTRTPILPVAVVGAEEQYFSFGNVPELAKLLRMPTFPLVPQFFVPGLQMPLPVKYRVYYGEPLWFEGDPEDDDAVIEEKVSRVRAEIEQMVRKGLGERKGLFR